MHLEHAPGFARHGADRRPVQPQQVRRLDPPRLFGARRGIAAFVEWKEYRAVALLVPRAVDQQVARDARQIGGRIARRTVDVHYGRDDFKDQGKLVRTLSRERTKDMAADFAKVDPARAFAERRGIALRERIIETAKKLPEIARQVPEKARSIFAGFKPVVKRASVEPRDTSRTADQRRAVQQYARAQADINRMRDKGLPVLRHQQDALARAGDALGTIGPHARADLASAFERQPELVGQAAQGNSQASIRAMQLEAEIRTDPARRADLFVEGWQKLQQQRERSLTKGEQRTASRLSGEMGAMAKSLERDAQVESILRTRKAALGIDARSVRPIGQELADIAGLGHGRSRGIGIGM